jgi:uncharacterized RDD family membrane protein YckC
VAESPAYAGLVSRAGALLLDIAILTVATLAVGGLPVLAWEQVLPGHHVPGWLSTASNAAAFALPWLYFTSFWWLTGQTVGDVVTGVTVHRIDGNGLGFWHAAVRALGCLVLAPLWLIGMLAVLWDRRRMAWHDHVFRTVVRYTDARSPAGVGPVPG